MSLYLESGTARLDEIAIFTAFCPEHEEINALLASILPSFGSLARYADISVRTQIVYRHASSNMTEVNLSTNPSYSRIVIAEQPVMQKSGDRGFNYNYSTKIVTSINCDSINDDDADNYQYKINTDDSTEKLEGIISSLTSSGIIRGIQRAFFEWAVLLYESRGLCCSKEVLFEYIYEENFSAKDASEDNFEVTALPTDNRVSLNEVCDWCGAPVGISSYSDEAYTLCNSCAEAHADSCD